METKAHKLQIAKNLRKRLPHIHQLNQKRIRQPNQDLNELFKTHLPPPPETKPRYKPTVTGPRLFENVDLFKIRSQLSKKPKNQEEVETLEDTLSPNNWAQFSQTYSPPGLLPGALNLQDQMVPESTHTAAIRSNDVQIARPKRENRRFGTSHGHHDQRITVVSSLSRKAADDLIKESGHGGEDPNVNFTLASHHSVTDQTPTQVLSPASPSAFDHKHSFAHSNTKRPVPVKRFQVVNTSFDNYRTVIEKRGATPNEILMQQVRPSGKQNRPQVHPSTYMASGSSSYDTKFSTTMESNRQGEKADIRASRLTNRQIVPLISRNNIFQRGGGTQLPSTRPLPSPFSNNDSLRQSSVQEAVVKDQPSLTIASEAPEEAEVDKTSKPRKHQLSKRLDFSEAMNQMSNSATRETSTGNPMKNSMPVSPKASESPATKRKTVSYYNAKLSLQKVPQLSEGLTNSYPRTSVTNTAAYPRNIEQNMKTEGSNFSNTIMTPQTRQMLQKQYRNTIDRCIESSLEERIKQAYDVQEKRGYVNDSSQNSTGRGKAMKSLGTDNTLEDDFSDRSESRSQHTSFRPPRLRNSSLVENDRLDFEKKHSGSLMSNKLQKSRLIVMTSQRFASPNSRLPHTPMDLKNLYDLPHHTSKNKDRIAERRLVKKIRQENPDNIERSDLEKYIELCRRNEAASLKHAGTVAKNSPTSEAAPDLLESIDVRKHLQDMNIQVEVPRASSPKKLSQPPSRASKASGENSAMKRKIKYNGEDTRLRAATAMNSPQAYGHSRNIVLPVRGNSTRTVPNSSKISPNRSPKQSKPKESLIINTTLLQDLCKAEKDFIAKLKEREHITTSLRENQVISSRNVDTRLEEVKRRITGTNSQYLRAIRKKQFMRSYQEGCRPFKKNDLTSFLSDIREKKCEREISVQIRQWNRSQFKKKAKVSESVVIKMKPPPFDAARADFESKLTLQKNQSYLSKFKETSPRPYQPRVVRQDVSSDSSSIEGSLSSLQNKIKITSKLKKKDPLLEAIEDEDHFLLNPSSLEPDELRESSSMQSKSGRDYNLFIIEPSPTGDDPSHEEISSHFVRKSRLKESREMSFMRRGSKLSRMMNLHKVEKIDSDTSFVTSESLAEDEDEAVAQLKLIQRQSTMFQREQEIIRLQNRMQKQLLDMQAKMPEMKVLKNPKYNFFFSNLSKMVEFPRMKNEAKILSSAKKNHFYQQFLEEHYKIINENLECLRQIERNAGVKDLAAEAKAALDISIAKFSPSKHL